MQKSLITKKVIAHSLKNLMKTTPFQKISISDIMSDANIRRQTFYDYFQDKYDLLAWIYEQETKENIEDYLDYEHWTKSITRLLYYLKENKEFYQNALQVSEQNSFDHYFFEHSKNLIKIIVSDVLNHQTHQTDIDDLDFFAQFYAYAFVGTTRAWILNDCPTDVLTLSSQIQFQLNNALKT